MSLEDKLSKLTDAVNSGVDRLVAALEANTVALCRVTVAAATVDTHDAEWIETEASRAARKALNDLAAQTAATSEAPAPRRRGRPPAVKPVEPVSTAPVVEEEVEPPAFDAEGQQPVDEEDPAFEVAMAAVEPETVAPAVVAVPPRAATVLEAKEMVFKVKELIGVEAAKAVVAKAVGRDGAKAAEIVTPEQCIAAVEAAEAALKAFEEEV